ncbi:MAG: IPT/TIG domain-containing protein [Elusimicrobia bacterium]|nr:IPT/TIG domain-containing protein [Elusimicrobiota bacterium]
MAELQGYSYKWQRDGVDYSADGSASITMNANHTMTFFNMPPPPTITSITPISGLNNATVSITNLTGTKFVSGATVKLTKAGQNDIAATAVGFMSSTQLTCTLPITGAVPGQWNVVVTNPDGQSGTLTNGFMVNAPYPTVTSIDPGLGTNNASLSITNLAGTGFYIGASVKLTQTGQADITAANIVVVNDTKITCDLPLNGAAIGQWNVIVANADTRSGALNNGFFVKAVPPTITSIAPAQGPNTGVVSITNLAGTSFLTGAAVKLTKTGQSDIPGTSVNVNAITSATITCTFDLTGAATGQWNVTVTNPDNNFVTLNNGFTVSLPAPVLSSVNPTSGLNTGSVTGAQLGGSYFISGAIVKLTKTGQSDIAVTGVVFVGPAQLTCTFPITGAVPGLWNVVVTNSDGQTNTLSNSFMVNAPYPTVASIDPSSGTNTGSLNISNLAGTNFYTGASVKLTKSGQTDIIATNVTVVSDTKITCTLLLNGAAIGLWNVVVTNADTRSGTLSNGFTVKAVPPTMTSIAPAQGVSTGTVSITNLAGTGFLSGAVVKLSKTGQTDITATSVNVVTAAKITCIFDLTNAATGTWNVTVTNLDNNSATLAGSFTVRLPAPAVSSVNPASGLNYTPLSGVIVNGSYFLSGATVKLAKAGQSDIAATDVVFVNSTQLTCTLPLTISMVPGQWNVVVTNTDAQSGTLGNGFNATVDATPPAGVPSTPSAGVVYTSSTIITFNWDQGTATDPESGIAGYYLQVGHNSALPANIFDGYVGNVFSKTFTGEGAYYARVRAKNPYDLYGNYSPWSAGAFIDTTPPSAPVVESPTNPSSAVTYISAAVTFNLSAQDTSGIAGYYYKIDQLTGTMPDNVSCAYFTGAATSTVLSAGAWYAHFVAVDMAGNIGVNEGHFNIHIGSAINPSQDNVFQAGDGATVAIPAGTLSAAADILISVPSSVPPAPRDATSKDTGISEEIKLSNAALTLQKNITISLPYTYSQVSTADEDSLKLSYYNTAKVRWEIIYDSVVDKIKKTVTAVVNHLSLFKIVAYTPQNGELASVGNYPNPFTAGRGGTTKIHYSLKADSSVDIRIYDLLGKPVWHKTLPSGAVGGSIGVNDVAWDGKNDKGAYVGAGAYICIVKAGSEKKTIKVAVK